MCLFISHFRGWMVGTMAQLTSDKRSIAVWRVPMVQNRITTWCYHKLFVQDAMGLLVSDMFLDDDFYIAIRVPQCTQEGHWFMYLGLMMGDQFMSEHAALRIVVSEADTIGIMWFNGDQNRVAGGRQQKRPRPKVGDGTIWGTILLWMQSEMVFLSHMVNGQTKGVNCKQGRLVKARDQLQEIRGCWAIGGIRA